MIANPELRRNLWLEATPVRLALMPVILAGIFFLAYVSDERTLGSAVALAALGCATALTWLWGAHLTSESILSELRGRTWDGQRTSGLAPWTLAWGKLLGATAYPWYGAALCLGVYLRSDPGHEARKGWNVALVVLGGLLAQAATMFAALQAASRGRAVTRARSSVFLVLGFLVLSPISAVFSGREVQWYGLRLPPLEIAVWSLAAFAALAIAGVWVRIRRELRARTLPLAWPAFVLFAMVWTGGFSVAAHQAPPGAPVLTGFVVAALLTWAAALLERKDPVVLRRLARSVRAGRGGRIVQELPSWLVTLPLVLAAWAVLFVSPGLVAGAHGAAAVRWTATAVVLFLLRDLALLVYLNLGARPGRADLFALVLLVVGYLLVPLILSATGWKPIAALFYPDPDRGPFSAAGAFLGAAVTVGLLAVRWRDRERALGGGPGDAPAARS